MRPLAQEHGSAYRVYMQTSPTPSGRLAAVLRVFQPLERFLATETRAGTLLIGVTAAALAIANSPWSDLYFAALEVPFTVGVGENSLSKPIGGWINDLLMAAFFLLVGLEIKREACEGELATLKKAALPAFAALGGMVVPAALYAAIAGGSGWGIPMATDIAFAIGVARMLGRRVPAAIVVFLTALAIIDDLGAILVIALFYGHEPSLPALAAVAAITGLLVAMNLSGVRRGALYVGVGLFLWFAVLESGIHATLAGVIVGWCVPASRGEPREALLYEARTLADIADDDATGPEDVDAALDALEERIDRVQSPLAELESGLHPYIAYGVIPIFALANAGVSLTGISLASLADPVSLGVIAGLAVGKPVGIVGASLLAVRAGVAELPAGVTWRHVAGAGCLGGIGFTMSLFIANLAFEAEPGSIGAAKLGILVASALAVALGAITLGTGRS